MLGLPVRSARGRRLGWMVCGVLAGALATGAAHAQQPAQQGQAAVNTRVFASDAGMVLNFITFKPLVKQVCDDLDHRTLIQQGHSMLTVRRSPKVIEVHYKDQRLILPRRDVILLPIANTSTELLAEYIAGKLRRRLRQDFPEARLHRIKIGVEETRGQRGFYCGEF